MKVRYIQGNITFLETRFMDPLTCIVICFGGAVVIGTIANLCPSEAEKANNRNKHYWEK
jgi:hypothetical protein